MSKKQIKPVIRPLSDAAYVPTRGTKNFNTSGTPISLDEAWAGSIAKHSAPGSIPQLPLSQLYTGDRYDSTIPGTDYEGMAGAQQSGLNQAVNGLLKGVNLTGTTVLGGFGTLYGVGKAVLPGGKLSDIWENPIMQNLDAWNKKVDEDWLPNYYSQSETASKWYETDNWFTPNFLFDKLIKNSGFAVGAMISGNIANASLMRVGTAIAKAASAADKANKFKTFTPLLRSTSRAFSQGKNIEAAQILEKELSGLSDLTARTKLLKDLANTTSKYTNFANTSRRTAVAAYSSAGEANFETVQSTHEYRETLISRFEEEHGKPPVGSDLEEIDRKSRRLGATAFVGNMALLGVTEWFQLPYLMGSSYRTTKAAATRVARETGDITIDAAGKAAVKPTTAFGRIFKPVKRVGTYVFDPKEAGQEFGQFALQVGAQNYWDKSHESNAADWYVDGVLHGMFGRDEDGKGVGAFTSKEGMEGGLIGGITGGLMQSRGKFRSHKLKAANTQKFVTSLNSTPSFRDAFKQKLRDANRGVVLQEQNEEAIKTGNKLESKDLKHDMMFNYLYNKIKYGRKDLIHSDVNDMLMKANTEAGLNELKEEGLANMDDTMESFGKRASAIIGYMDSLEKMADNVYQVYGGTTVTDKEGNTKPAYSEEVMEKLTYAASKIADYDIRIPQLQNELMLKGIVDTQTIDEVLDDTPKNLEDVVLEQQVKIEESFNNKKITDTQAKELNGYLDDYVELNLRKNSFFDEYNDMITSPAKYEEASQSVVVPPESLITIKTKNGEKEVSIGKEYRLGTVVEYTKEGYEVYRAPSITIIEQKEDGKLVVQDTNGKVYEVSPDQIEDYDLIDAEEIAKNKTVKWFMDHWNEKFIHKSIKHKKGEDKGKPIEGRVSIDRKNHKDLYFVYKDDNGKRHVVPLKKFHFIANKAKGFTKPIFEKVGVLTAVQKNSTNEMALEQEPQGEMSEKVEKRNNLLSDLFDELSNKMAKSKKLVKNKQTQLEKIREDLVELRKKIKQSKGDRRVKSSFRFKAETKKALQRAISLANTERQLEAEIVELEQQEAQIEITQLQVMDMVDELEVYSERPKEFLAELQDNILNLEIAQEKTGKQINAIHSLIKSTKNTIKSAVKFLETLIASFESKYPDIPLIVGKRFFDNNNDTLLRSELDKVMDAIEFTEEETIVPNETRVKDLEEHLKIMSDDFVLLDKQIEAQETIWEYFEKIYSDYQLQLVEEKVFGSSENLKVEAAETHDTIGVPNVFDEDASPKSYEPEKKKEEYDVVSSTKTLTEIVDSKTGKVIVKSRDHHKRSNRFGFNFHSFKNKDDIKGIVVNERTEEGLLDGLMVHLKGESDVLSKDTLAFVMVVNTPKGIRLVDEFGKPITDGKDVLNRAIYQTFPAEDEDGKLTAWYNREKQSMFRNTAQNVEALTKAYSEWRIAELARETRGSLENIKVSFGVPDYGTSYSETTTAKEAGLIDNDMLVKSDVLIVATTSDEVSNGSVIFKTPLGRVFLKVPGGLAKTQNRKHTTKEAEAIYSVLNQLAIQFQEDGTFKTKRSADLFKWLKSVTYWGIVKDQQKKTKEKGYNSIWFEGVNVDGEVIPKLMFSKNRQGISFTPTSLKTNQNLVQFILENMYLNVDASLVDGEAFNTPYSQILGIDNSGKPITRIWPNYQSYLLSDKNPDTRQQLTQSRGKDDIPLVTQYAPVTPTDPVNRHGIYFTRASAKEELYIEPKAKPVAPPETEATPETVTPEKKETPAKTVKAVLPLSEPEESGTYKPRDHEYDGVQKNLTILPNNDSAFFSLDLEKAKEVYDENPVNLSVPTELIAFVGKLTGLGLFDVSVNRETMENRLKEQPHLANQAGAYSSIVVSVFKDLASNFNTKFTEPTPYTAKAPVLDGKTENIIDVDGLGGVVYTLDIAKANKILETLDADVLSDPKKKLQFITKLDEEKALTFVIDEVLANKAATKAGKSVPAIYLRTYNTIINNVKSSFVLSKLPSDEKIEAAPKEEPEVTAPKNETQTVGENKTKTPEAGGFADTLNYDEFETDDEKGMRALLENQTTDVTPESWEEVSAWLSKNFPNLPVYRVKRLIENTNGEQNWGMFHRGALYVYENAETGTAYHEVFEAVWKMFTTPQERQKIVDEFRDRKGTYRDRFSGKEIEYSKATAKELKEELAEEFRDKRLYNISPKRNKGKSWIERLFIDLLNFFKSFIVGKDALNNTAKLFSKIETGGYKDKLNPYGSKLSFANVGFQYLDSAVGDETSEFRKKINDIPAQQQHDIMQHMTFEVLRRIIKTNDSLFSLNEASFNKKALYADLKMAVIGSVAKKINQTTKDTPNTEEGRKESELTIYENKVLINQINEQWDNIVSNHEEVLQNYAITFDENDEVAIRDDEKGKSDPYGSPLKIDQYRKASYAVKFLLGSLPRVDNENKIINSSIGGAQLIPADKVVADLKSKLFDSINLDDMLNRLGEISMSNPEYANLYTRLLNNPPSNQVDYSKVEERGLELISGLWKIMKGQNPDVLAVFIFPDGIQIADSALAGAAKAAKYEAINSMILKIKEGSDFFTYNRTSGRYTSSEKIKKQKLSKTTPQTYTQFLKHFGIDVNPVYLETRLKDDQRNAFFSAIDGILLSLQNVAGIKTISANTLGIEGQTHKLGSVLAVLDNPEFESTYFNLNGEKSQTHIGDNTLSNLYHAITHKSIKTINDLKNTPYKYLLTDSFAKGSLIMNKIFNMSGDKGKRDGVEDILKPVLIDGTGDFTKGKKKQSSKLTLRERVLQGINLNLDGVYENLVPGDATLEHAVKLHNKKNPFVTIAELDAKTYFRIFEDYFAAEVNLVRDKRIVHKDHDSAELRFFKPILEVRDSVTNKRALSETTYKAIMKQVNKPAKTKLSPTVIYEMFQDEIEAAIELFITEEAKDVEALLTQFGAITFTDDGIDVSELAAEKNSLLENNKGIDIHTLRASLKAVSLNYVIANIELHKVLYSDPYQYFDELKRIKNFNSPRQPLIVVTKKIGTMLHRLFNEKAGYGDKKDIGYTDFRRSYFRTVTIIDVKSWYDIPGVTSKKRYDEADGAAFITLKGMRKYATLSNNWSKDDERQYRYEIAWEKDFKNIKLSKAEVKILKEGNPEIRSAFTTRKPIVSGGKLNDRSYNDVVLDKYALIPYSYRTLHEINANSNGLKLYDKMMREDIDYVIFQSGRKVGAEKTLDLYNKEGYVTDEIFDDREEQADIYAPQRLIKIPFNIMSVQSEVPSKDEHKVTRGSQITKLVTLDYLEGGIPIDFFPDKTPEDRFIAWTKLSDKTSYTSSLGKDKVNLYTLISRNQEILENSIELGYRSLLKEFGISQVGNTFVLKNKTKLAETLKSEMLKREINNNVSDAFDDFKKGDIIVEATPAYQQIRHILYSIADKRVVSAKITGGMKVQVPSTLLESKKVYTKKLNGKNGYVSDTLNFYVNEDGKRVAEIGVARWFKSDLTDEELLDSWYEKNKDGTRSDKLTEEGRKVLSGVGFRTPTQKQNSIEVFVIKMLLPNTFGDNVVVPSKIVEKTGSDFDIDKLSIYLKNVFINKKTGEVTAIKYLTNENSTVQQRYAKYVKDEIKEYGDIKRDVKRDSIEWQQLQDRIGESYQEFFDVINKMKEDNIIPLSNSLDELKTKIQNKADASEHIYALGYDIFKSLPQGLQDVFRKWNAFLDKEVAAGKIERFQKTLEFKGVAQDWINTLQDNAFQMEYQSKNGAKVVEIITDEAIPTLKALMANYDLFLTTIGYTPALIKQFHKDLEALKSNREVYRDTRAEMREGLDSSKNNIYEEFNEEFNKALSEVFNLMSIDEFKAQNMDLQNSKQALENEYVESLESLVSHPLNFNDLVKPNSADDMKALARELNGLLKRPEIDYSSTGNMISRRFMSGLRHAFVSGKYAIGIAAVNQTNHSLMQRFASYIDIDKIDDRRYVSEIDAKWLGDGIIKFKNYNKINVKGKGLRATLSGIRSASKLKEKISDIIGMFIDGYVDISAGPWIMELGATPSTASTWLFLIKAGVPIKDIVFFMNQPIIRDYLQLLQNAGYSYLFIKNFQDVMNSQYQANEDVYIKNIPSLTSLKATVNKKAGDMNDSEKSAQVFMLQEFLKYAKLSGHMFQVTQGTNFDTANFNDATLVFKKSVQLEQARNTIISSTDEEASNAADSILKHSFIGKLAEILDLVRDAMSTVLISDRVSKHPSGVGTRSTVEAILTPYVNINDRAFLKVAQRAVSNLFDWFVFTERGLSGKKVITDTLLGDSTAESAAAEIMRFKKEIENGPTTHPLYNNLVLKSLQIDVGKNTKSADNLKIVRRDNKSYDQNLIIAAFNELRAVLGVEKGGLYGKLVRLAILQSGTTYSRISFTHLLPYEDFVETYKAPLSIIDKSARIANFTKLDVFQRNNWNDANVVPFYRDKLVPYIDRRTMTQKMFSINTQTVDKKFKQAMNKGHLPKIVSIGKYSREGQSDFLTFSWGEKPTAEQKAAGVRTFITKKALVKKVYHINDFGERVPLVTETTSKKKKDADGKYVVYENFIYKAINAWGDGNRAQEFYDKKYPLDSSSTLGDQSVLDNGYEKYTEVEDEQVTAVYNADYMDLKQEARDISFTDDNKARILSGDKTTTIRYYSHPNGIYNIKGKKFFLKSRGYLSVQDAGGIGAMIESEAYPTKPTKYNKIPVEYNGQNHYVIFENTAKFLEGNQKMWVFDLKDVTDEYAQENLDSAERVDSSAPKAENPLVVNIYSTDKNGFQDLSNFSPKRPYTDSSGRKFAHVEAAFQYAKTQFANGNNESIRKQLLHPGVTGAKAKYLGSPRSLKGLSVPVWNNNAFDVMYKIIKDSFIQNPDQIPLLMSTGDAILTHIQDTSVWNVEFPRILMRVRNELSLEFDSSKNKPTGMPGIDRTSENC